MPGPQIVKRLCVAPVVAGVARWDLAQPVPDEQLPHEIELERALVRVQMLIDQMADDPAAAAWAARIAQAAAVPAARLLTGAPC